MKAIDQGFRFKVNFGIECLMGLTVTSQKSGETQYIAASGAADDDRPARSCF